MGAHTMKKMMAMMILVVLIRNSIQKMFDDIYSGVMEIFRKLLMIPTTDEAAGADLDVTTCLDKKHQDKESVSNTSKFKYLKERWFF